MIIFMVTIITINEWKYLYNLLFNYCNDNYEFLDDGSEDINTFYTIMITIF